MITKECFGCGNVSAHQHLHDCANGIAETHMVGSERFVCELCGQDPRAPFPAPTFERHIRINKTAKNQCVTQPPHQSTAEPLPPWSALSTAASGQFFTLTRGLYASFNRPLATSCR
jgi:hypothetical protein